jgi:probable phosphoglycerate mutase
VDPVEVSLNEEGRAQAEAAATALEDVELDRVLTSGLRRTVETASIVAPGREPEAWPELSEIRGGRLSDIPPDALESEFVHAFRGIIPGDARFLRGESIDELFDRVLPAVARLVTDESWDTALAVLHGGVNRAILSFALTGERTFLGHFEQAPGCINVLDIGSDSEWIVRAVGVAPYDLLHRAHRQTTMERYWDQYRGLAGER